MDSIVIVYEEGKEKKRTVYYNAVSVKLPSYGHKLYRVVVKGLGMEPMEKKPLGQKVSEAKKIA